MGFPINYREAGAGDPIVFLHGMGCGAASWEFQLEEFAKTHRAIAWDMPGHGSSAAINPMTMEGLAAALIRLLDHLEIYDAHLVGLSMGGMIVQEIAAGWPNRVKSLVLSATSPAFGPPDGEFQKKFIASRLAPLDAGENMAELAGRVVGKMFGPDANPQGVETAITAFAATPTETYRASVQCIAAFDRRDALASIRVPTLVLAGERDQNAPAAMMERMAAKITGAIHTNYVCLAEADHLANQEFPERYNAALQEFYAALKQAN